MPAMMRPRFSSGLVVGLSVGMPVGAMLVLFALPPRGGMGAEQVRELTALRTEIEALRESSGGAAQAASVEVRDALGQLAQERERVQTQLGLFEELANQVSASLARVQMRLDALERREVPTPAERLPQEPRFRDWE